MHLVGIRVVNVLVRKRVYVFLYFLAPCVFLGKLFGGGGIVVIDSFYVPVVVIGGFGVFCLFGYFYFFVHLEKQPPE